MTAFGMYSLKTP